jgi:hypothetical protein
LVAVLDANECRATNALNFTTADTVVFALADPLKISRNKLKFQSGASGVHNQDVHCFC